MMIHRLKSSVNGASNFEHLNGLADDPTEQLPQRSPTGLWPATSRLIAKLVDERPATTLLAGLLVGTVIGYALKRVK